MCDAAEQFRARLSVELRKALADRDREAIVTLRCIMAAIDNASAVSPEEGARFAASLIAEAPRRRLSDREIAAILQAEVDARSKAAEEYERVGNVARAAQLRAGIATVEHVMTLLR